MAHGSLREPTGKPRSAAASTLAFRGENGKVKGATIAEVEWTDKGPKPIPGTERDIDCDLVLLAMGFVGPVKEGLVADLGVDLDGRGNVFADDFSYKTSVDKVFAAGDMRRGMYVTALYLLVDPAHHAAQVICAGHKVPLLRYTAADRKLRKVHPGGIALGFDKGPVFDRSLEVVDFDLAPGDRLVLTSQGPLQVVDPDGEELGEELWFDAVGRHAKAATTTFLRGLKNELAEFADEEPFPKDVSILTVLREAP